MKLSYKSPVIIYNPVSGEGKGGKIFKKYYGVLGEIFKTTIDVHTTNGTMDDLTDYIKSVYDDDRHDCIICVGGDGTISQLTNVLMHYPMDKRLPLLPLPGGTGDSLVKDFSIDTIQDAVINVQNSAVLRMYDVLKVEELDVGNTYYSINIFGMAFITEIVKAAIKYGKRFGTLSYLFGAVAGMKKFSAFKTTIICDDDETIEFDKMYYLSLSNTIYTGGAVKIAPQALYNDGLMDMVVLHDIGRVKYLSGYLKAMKGMHLHEEGCFYKQVKSVEIRTNPVCELMNDGDLTGTTPVRVTVVPKMMPLII